MGQNKQKQWGKISSSLSRVRKFEERGILMFDLKKKKDVVSMIAKHRILLNRFKCVNSELVCDCDSTMTMGEPA